MGSIFLNNLKSTIDWPEGDGGKICEMIASFMGIRKMLYP
jgi:hypothetical protein